MNEQRGLTIRSLCQLFNWTAPRDFAQLAPKNVIRFLKQVGGRRKLFCQVASHPDGLRTLSGKQQRNLRIHDSR